MARRECPLRVRLGFLAVALAVTAMLLAGCGGGGGGDDPAEVEANLRHYLSTLDPMQSGFPVGAGRPRVKENSCTRIPKDQVGQVQHPPWPRRAPAASWSCVVRFAHTPFRVLVALKDSGEVAWAMA